MEAENQRVIEAKGQRDQEEVERSRNREEEGRRGQGA